MNLRTTKNPVFCPMGLRRAMPTALAFVATLALVSSAQAQTYTWTGASPSNGNWFSTISGSFTSGNFSSSPLVSSYTGTDLVLSGSLRTTSNLNRSGFQTNSLTLKDTSSDFVVNGSNQLNIGAGGIDIQVAQKLTLAGSQRFEVGLSGTSSVKVATGGELQVGDDGENFYSTPGTIIEKTGLGTLTIRSSGQGILKNTQGTTNLRTTPGQWAGNVEVSGGQMNVIAGADIGTLSFGGISRQTGGVFSMMGTLTQAFFDKTGGTMYVGESTSLGGGASFSSGTVSYTGEVGGGAIIAGSATISGGIQDFGAGLFGPAVVTGGTTSGFFYTSGLTNNGGTITFTAVDAGLSPTFNTPGPATNEFADLTLTSGSVSISTIGGSTPAIGSLVNGTIGDPLNTFLGTANTLNLDFNEDLSRDLLITSGTLNWGGNVALNLTNLGEMPNGSSWNFFNDGVLGNTGAFTGTLDGISLAATDTYNGLSFTKSGSLWTSTSTGGGQQFTFNETTGVLAVVPEPSSIAAAGMGLAMLGWRRLARRRRAAA